MKSRHRFFAVINNFEGWPDGPLAEDIRQHALHLFETVVDAQDSQYAAERLS